MRVGVVCEGPTDFHAIQYFLGHSLSVNGIDAEFVPLQPKMDNTLPCGGWGNVLSWLDRNPPTTRIQKYFGGGLFGGGLATEPLDALLIHLDSDVLGEPKFESAINKQYGHVPNNPLESDKRADEIRSLLALAARMTELTDKDASRHVLAPAVESTETWCIAAFDRRNRNYEQLSGQELVDEFMSALETCEGKRPTMPYANINKTPRRRMRFCKEIAGNSNRVVNGCIQFRRVHEQLISLR